MRQAAKMTAVVLAAAIALSACGGSGSGGGSGTAVNSQRPSREYVVRLSGAVEAPPTHGTGYAIIALHDPAHQVCFRFAHLHGFLLATNAGIARAPARHTGRSVLALSIGPRLHHRGCVPARTTLMAAIAAHPGAYYVEIRSVANPHGAVRAQL
jgi:hypothetical protein